MYRLIESIKLQNRQLQHIEWHNKRFNEARHQLFGMHGDIDLSDVIDIPEHLSTEVYKCRVLYRKEVEVVEFQPYLPRDVRTLQLLEVNDIDYTYKFEDRQVFDSLMSRKGQADDILIVKNGYITDTSYSNIVFFDGEKWITPDTYLLNGTQRQYLLTKKIITEAKVMKNDLKNFPLAKPINAMLDFDRTPLVSIIYSQF